MTLSNDTRYHNAARVLPAPVGVIAVDPLDEPAIPRALELFGALHAHNAALDARFALADDWRPRVAAHLRHMITCADCCCRLAWAGEEAVGLLLGEVHEDPPIFRVRHWVELLALYVAPTQRGTGLADRLLADLTAWTTRRGLDAVQLYVTASNLPARRFYRRHGFRASQVVMRRVLAPAPSPEPGALHALPASLSIEPGAERYVEHPRPGRARR
jgi:ribosomal protein S18 acetylase RimI-like enzyme